MPGPGGGCSTQMAATPAASNSRSTANNSCATAAASAGMARWRPAGLGRGHEREYTPSSLRVRPCPGLAAAQPVAQGRGIEQAARSRRARSARPACPRRAAKRRRARPAPRPAPLPALRGRAARAQQRRALARAVDDGRLDADVAGAAVEHHQRGTELLQHVRGRGRADAAEAVGARRRHAGHAQRGRRAQQGQRHRVRRQPQADARPARRPPRAATPGRRGTITVSGPGQNAAIRRCAARGPGRRRRLGAAAARRRERSAGGRRAGPWRRRCAPPPCRRRRARPARRRSRWERPPVRRRPAAWLRPRDGMRVVARQQGHGAASRVRTPAGRAAPPPAAPWRAPSRRRRRSP